MILTTNMDNIIRFKDNKKLEKVLLDLTRCLAFTSGIIEEMRPHRIYTPIGDLLSQAHDTRAMLNIHIAQIKKELERK